ncbi:hypothetical protein LguiA_004279 [Lonicera macranthoides]
MHQLAIRTIEDDQFGNKEPQVSDTLESKANLASGSEEENEVLVCSSSSSFRQKSSFLGSKLKSRIIQQPEYDCRSKGFLKSRISGESSESNEDDPFLEDDLPEEYKKMKLGKGAVDQTARQKSQSTKAHGLRSAYSETIKSQPSIP